MPWVLVLNPGISAKSVKELIDHAKARPGKLNFATPGTGTPNHLSGVLLMVLTGIDMTHVPYKGAGAGMIADLISGQAHVSFTGLTQTLPHMKTGRLKVIAVGHPTRLRAMPDVPAVAETIPGFNTTGWCGLLAPAGSPRSVVDKVNAELNKAFGAPEMVKRLEGQGLEAATSTPAGMGQMIREDLARWRKVIKDAGITVESAR